MKLPKTAAFLLLIALSIFWLAAMRYTVRAVARENPPCGAKEAR
jgi:hypothetical protein